MAFTNKTAAHIQAAVDAAFAAQNFPSSKPEQQAPVKERADFITGYHAGMEDGRRIAERARDECGQVEQQAEPNDAKDAARYRWLRDTEGSYATFGECSFDTMDEVVDAAMAAHPPAQDAPVMLQVDPKMLQTTIQESMAAELAAEYERGRKAGITQVYDAKLKAQQINQRLEQVKQVAAVWEQMKMKPSGTEADVCADILKRQQLGINKYGTTIRDNPLELREWLQHAYEECLDQAVYLKRAMEEIDWKDADAEVMPVGPSL